MHVESIFKLILSSSVITGTVAAQATATAGSNAQAPQATIKNGTLRGLHLASFGQDLFLGVPFAEPPVGNLRFRHPVPYKTSWHGVRKAVARSKSCVGYAGFAKGLDLGEDCLTLDIVRPAGTESGDKLPVLVWIYGGGFTAGGSADGRYNTSYMVNASVAIKKPIMTVSINYRLGGWGFLASKEVQAAGASNSGLFDQRLALLWIKENIAAFGGDPNRVTIAGESAGAFSVGYHLVGFDGNSDGLFRAAILQSGTALGPSINTPDIFNTTYQPIYDNITSIVGCASSADSLACLRKADYQSLYKALAPFVLTPVLDGKFLSRLPSESFARGMVADVAILAGTNTDEGTATFFGPRGTLHNNSNVQQFAAKLGRGLTSNAVKTLMKLYPDNPYEGCPFHTGAERFASLGAQYKRGATIVGDMVIHSGRRSTTKYFAERARRARKPVYSYRFDQSPWNNSLDLITTEAPVYATHYAEICFVFNLDPHHSRNNSNWIGPYPEYHVLAASMSRSWISFVHSLNPNALGNSDLPYWPDYSNAAQNLVLRARGSFVETDDWRHDQLKYWDSIWAQLGT